MKPITLQLAGRLSVRVYEDCRPNCLETGALQKGLVLMLDGFELIEEGMGFGLPIVKYQDKTFFSSTANVSITKVGSEWIITKVYTLDTVSIKKFGQASYIDDGLYSPLRKIFQTLYLKHKKLSPLFNKAMELRDLANVKTEFVVVKPRGTITVTYKCRPTTIDIQADFSGVALNKCLEMLMLNEQGSNTFQKYSDSNGSNLICSKIGAWGKITSKYASLMSMNGQISFSLRNRENVTFFRGWERTRNRFSWAGLSYSIVPNNSVFAYTISLKSTE
ncbi:MAG: hypothetical protein ACM3UL_04440 [Ignavibacteria bacterium]